MRTPAKKIITLSFIWSAQMFCYVIRFALAVAAPTLMQLYDITPKTMGFILSGWNWPYTAVQFLVGPLVDRFGVFLMMGVGSGVWGLTTVALPVASTAASLFLMRAIFGIGHSMVIPGSAASIARAFPPQERARAIGVAYSGSQVGLAIGGTISALILTWWGWEAVFYCLGGASLLMTLSWFFFYPDKQDARPALSSGRAKQSGQQYISWFSLFRYRSTWGIAFGQFGYLYVQFFFANWLPGYLILERKMTLLKTGVVSSLPFLAGMLGTLGGGWLGDYLIRRGVSPTVARKSIIGAGMIAATFMVVTAAFTEQDWLAVTLLTLTVGCMRMTTASVNAVPIDLAPPMVVGALTSIHVFSASTGGLLAPIVTGYIVSATGSFVGALVAAGGMALFSAISYLFILGKVETYQVKSRGPAPAVTPAPSSTP